MWIGFRAHFVRCLSSVRARASMRFGAAEVKLNRSPRPRDRHDVDSSQLVEMRLTVHRGTCPLVGRAPERPSVRAEASSVGSGDGASRSTTEQCGRNLLNT
ncbi:MAG: hypothetical protein ABI156_12955, partial [Caldimonas sp.]